MPTYRVDVPGSDLPRVVVATMPATAMMHVAKSELTVRRIEVDEAFALAEQGVKLERPGEELPPAPIAKTEDTSNTLATEQEDTSQESEFEREARLASMRAAAPAYEPGVTGSAGTHLVD